MILNSVGLSSRRVDSFFRDQTEFTSRMFVDQLLIQFDGKVPVSEMFVAFAGFDQRSQTLQQVQTLRGIWRTEVYLLFLQK